MDNLLLKKLQVKPGFVIKVVDAPDNAEAIFGSVPKNVFFNFDNVDNFDVLITFTTSQNQLEAQIESHLKYLNATTVFWVFTPKKSSKIKTDLDLMNTWQELNVYGLNPCSSAAVNEIWTALRLKFITEIKPSGLGNDHIKKNDYADYIDVVNKTVKLPEDLESLLQKEPKAFNHFQTLAYSHKKEYVLWILSAKQEKTRFSRLEKTVEMLLLGKKNPTDK